MAYDYIIKIKKTPKAWIKGYVQSPDVHLSVEPAENKTERERKPTEQGRTGQTVQRLASSANWNGIAKTLKQAHATGAL